MLSENAVKASYSRARRAKANTTQGVNSESNTLYASDTRLTLTTRKNLAPSFQTEESLLHFKDFLGQGPAQRAFKPTPCL